jgi:hypothetical protein
MFSYTITKSSLGWLVTETSVGKEGSQKQLRKWYFKSLDAAMDFIREQFRDTH